MSLQQPAPLPPPVHPDVQMKALPFYDVLDVLIKPSSLGASTVQRYHQEKYFIFALTPQQVREICISRDFLPGGRRDYMVQIQLRFCLSETSCPQEDNYPNSLCIKVNGKLFPLPGYAPPPKNGVEQKRPGRALNITSLVRLSSAVPNQISVTWAPEIGKTYSLSVYLVRQLTSPLLLQRLRMKGIRNPDHSRALIKEKLTADPDSEIATTSLRVSLMCPLGKMRLTVPCRALTCSHLQCFDAALYLQMNEKKPTWICPVCDKKAAYEGLIIDGLFMEILNDCSDVDEIKFQEDGTWCPMRPKQEALKLSSQCIPKVEASAPQRPSPAVVSVCSEPSSPSSKKADVIDLTLDSSSSSSSENEEEEEDPPLKKRCLYMTKTEDVHGKGVLTYQPSSGRMPTVPSLDAPYLSSTLADYAVPFHHSSLASIPTDMQSLDLFSLIQADSQHYRAPMFLDTLSGGLPGGGASGSALVTSSSTRYEPGLHGGAGLHGAGPPPHETCLGLGPWTHPDPRGPGTRGRAGTGALDSPRPPGPRDPGESWDWGPGLTQTPGPPGPGGELGLGPWTHPDPRGPGESWDWGPGLTQTPGTRDPGESWDWGPGLTQTPGAPGRAGTGALDSPRPPGPRASEESWTLDSLNLRWAGLRTHGSRACPSVPIGSLRKAKGPSVPIGSLWKAKGPSVPIGSLRKAKGPSVPIGSLWKDKGPSVPIGSLRKAKGPSVPIGSLRKAKGPSVPIGSLWKAKGPSVPIGSLRKAKGPSVPIGSLWKAKGPSVPIGSLRKAKGPSVPIGSLRKAKGPSVPIGSLRKAKGPSVPIGSLWKAKGPSVPIGSLRKAKGPSVPIGSLRKAKGPSVPIGSLRKAKRPSVPIGSLRKAKGPSVPIGSLRKAKGLPRAITGDLSGRLSGAGGVPQDLPGRTLRPLCRERGCS
ncbi:unnamed protein product [Boreogadus saida]